MRRYLSSYQFPMFSHCGAICIVIQHRIRFIIKKTRLVHILDSLRPSQAQSSSSSLASNFFFFNGAVPRLAGLALGAPFFLGFSSSVLFSSSSDTEAFRLEGAGFLGGGLTGAGALTGLVGFDVGAVSFSSPEDANLSGEESLDPGYL